MNLLIGILIALIIIGVVVWAINKILSVVTIPEPFRTIIWVIVVVIAVLAFLQISGLYHFSAIH
jgi:hypothetical protein